MAKKVSNKNRLSRDAWLQRALEVLREEGIQGVRIERLARDLGVTKGSFYWHFEDRDDLWRSILEFWSEKYTDTVVENEAFRGEDPAADLLAAMSKVRKEGLEAYELAVRAWADHDEMAEKAVQEVYARRTRFVESFFKRLGFRGAEAELRARMMLCYLSWEPSLHPEDSQQRRMKLLKMQIELLTKK